MSVSAAVYSVKDVPNVQLQDSTRLVSDPDDYISAAVEDSINLKLRSLRSRTTCEVVAVVLGDIDFEDVDLFATSLFTEWGLGKKSKSNGLLVLLIPERRKAVIRTGYGVEAALPDVVCGRIIRDDIAPAAKEDNYDVALTNAIDRVDMYLSNPNVVDELVAEEQAREDQELLDGVKEFFMYWLLLGLAGALLFIIILLHNYNKNKDKPKAIRYREISSWNFELFCSIFLGLGVPILAYLVYRILRRRVRVSPAKCPNCGQTMKRLDEKADNAYLNPTQDFEEKINSVDYDVWLCPGCGETDIIPYVKKGGKYSVCTKCGTRANCMTSDRVLEEASCYKQGKGRREYTCKRCGKVTATVYTIPKLKMPTTTVRGSGGGGGGSYSGGGGGSFGGGSTGGGGASGGW